jgi:hypothetical protein
MLSSLENCESLALAVRFRLSSQTLYINLISSAEERMSHKHKAGGSIPSSDKQTLDKKYILKVYINHQGIWRNGSAIDSKSIGWEFKSLCSHKL